MQPAPSIIQAAAWYPPHDMGGTEVYLEAMTGALGALGFESRVIVPRHPDAAARYVHHGVDVATYPVDASPSRTDIKGGQPHRGFADFLCWLSAQERGLYHQHSWTRGCGPHHLRAARDLGFKTVLTIHVPGNICLRGTMLRYGEAACDGHVQEKRCAACWAQSRGQPKRMAEFLSELPLSLAQAAQCAPGRLSTALSARALGHAKAAQLAEMVADCDHVVVVCQWLLDALRLNGAPEQKISLSRQGVEGKLATALRLSCARRNTEDRTLRLLYLGRWDRVKGIHIVVDALRALPPHVDVRLSVHASGESAQATAYEGEVREMARGDARITIRSRVEREALPDLLAEYDVLLVPSQWLETGPLVVLEAQAAGLHVLGSRMGGIAELLQGAAQGELLEPGDRSAWAAAIARLAAVKRRGALPRTPADVRMMDSVAADMTQIYRRLLTVAEQR